MEGMNVMKKWQKVGMAVVTFIVALGMQVTAYGEETKVFDTNAQTSAVPMADTPDNEEMYTAYTTALGKVDSMRDRFKAQADVVDALKKATHQFSDHQGQMAQGLLSLEQAAYQYVADYIFLIHEIRLLTIFDNDRDGWEDRLKSEEDQLQENLHEFQSLNDPFTLQQMIGMADFDLISEALSEEEVVKASSISLASRDERSLIDMTGTWFSVIGTVTLLVILTLIEFHTSFMSTTFRRTKRRLVNSMKK